MQRRHIFCQHTSKWKIYMFHSIYNSYIQQYIQLSSSAIFFKRCKYGQELRYMQTCMDIFKVVHEWWILYVYSCYICTYIVPNGYLYAYWYLKSLYTKYVPYTVYNSPPSWLHGYGRSLWPARLHRVRWVTPRVFLVCLHYHALDPSSKIPIWWGFSGCQSGTAIT